MEERPERTQPCPTPPSPPLDPYVRPSFGSRPRNAGTFRGIDVPSPPAASADEVLASASNEPAGDAGATAGVSAPGCARMDAAGVDCAHAGDEARRTTLRRPAP